MSFIDQVKIYVKAGNGGKGCFSFYDNRRTAKRYPDGGDGGRGGDVIINCNSNLWDLTHLKFQKHFKAKNGAHGSSNKKKGKDGRDTIIEVPPGTIIKDHLTDSVIKELIENGESILVARGGKGGRGNAFTKSDPLPPGIGEDKLLYLELKLLAHVGLVGYPNAGKTTLINSLCQTKGKVADYPFTTLEPLLGVIWHKDKAIKIADIPGLIEEAHKGKGLGDDFLKHIQRTHMLIFVLGLADIDPLAWEAFRILRTELEKFDVELSKKDYFILANKIDLPEAKQNFKILSRKFKGINIMPISALFKIGIEEFKDRLISYFEE